MRQSGIIMGGAAPGGFTAPRRPVAPAPSPGGVLGVSGGSSFVGGPQGYARVLRTSSCRGLFRIFNPPAYRFFWSNSAPPVEGTTPQATNSTLAFTTSSTFADGTWYFSVSYFDGVNDSGFYPIGPQGQTYLTLVIAGGVAGSTAPSPPTRMYLEQRAGGVIRVHALYTPITDGTNAADHFAIAYTTDGSTPPNNSASITVAIAAEASLAVLSYDLPAQTDGTIVKVEIQSKKSTVYSAPTPVLSATAVVNGPGAPLFLGTFLGPIPESL